LPHLPLQSALATRAAVPSVRRRGKRIEEMDALISDQAIDESGIVITGTPEACLRQLDEVLLLTKPYGFDIVDRASPLGPGWDESIDIVCQVIPPELQRRS